MVSNKKGSCEVRQIEVAIRQEDVRCDRLRSKTTGVAIRQEDVLYGNSKVRHMRGGKLRVDEIQEAVK